MNYKESINSIEWHDNSLFLLDQRALPAKEAYLELNDVKAVAVAIKDMVVRGAPAIGITAAYGVVLAAIERWQQDSSNWKSLIENDLQILAESRPTAVNLFWALECMRKAIVHQEDDPANGLLAIAQRIHREDIESNLQMGEHGVKFLSQDSVIVTHCNAGTLATGGFGTALGVIKTAFQKNKLDAVYACETRPWLQGARLTAWELQKNQIPVTLLCEGAAASLFSRNKIDWVIVGADRVAANGDVANKIGTYSLAVLARHHGVKFMVVAPSSTVDLATTHGDEIPLEFRSAQEVLVYPGASIASVAQDAWNPVFDVTPAHLIDVFVCERGAVETPDFAGISALLR